MDTNTNTATISAPTSAALGTPEADREIFSAVALGDRPESDLTFVSAEFLAARRGNLKTISTATKGLSEKVKAEKDEKEVARVKAIVDRVESLGKLLVVIPTSEGADPVELTLTEALMGKEGRIKVAAKGTKGTADEKLEERDHTYKMTASRADQFEKILTKLEKVMRNEEIREKKGEKKDENAAA